MTWLEHLDERQRKAVAFAENYVANYNHGTTGHNDLTLIARLAELLEYATTHAGELPQPTLREDLPIGFGQHAKQTLRELARGNEDQQSYVDWLAREARDPEVKAAAQRALTAETKRRSELTRELFDREPTVVEQRGEAAEGDGKEIPF